MQRQRCATTIGRSDEAEPASALPRRETPLLATRLESRSSRAQPDLEDVGPMDSRRVDLPRSQRSAFRRTSKLTGQHEPDTPRRVLPAERPLADEGHHLGLRAVVAQSCASRSETALGEDLETSEADSEIARRLLSKEGQPDSASGTVLGETLLGPANPDH